MMQKGILFLALCSIYLVSCVQPSGRKTIKVLLHTQGIKNINTIGIRGNEKPLSWDNDLQLTPITKDSLYTATFFLVTGYTFTEAKFTVNGEYELQNKDNRRIVFADKDTTIYEATFNAIVK
jgi:putative oxidoreductase